MTVPSRRLADDWRDPRNRKIAPDITFSATKVSSFDERVGTKYTSCVEKFIIERARTRAQNYTRIDLIRSRLPRSVPAARAWWFVRRPHTYGSVVALWHGDRVLLVRSSYRNLYTLPGGFLRSGETARDAAIREVFEELRIAIAPDALSAAWHGSITFEHRDDTVTVWETTLDSSPPAQIDGGELIWAGWKTRAQALSLPLLPHVRAYLTSTGKT